MAESDWPRYSIGRKELLELRERLQKDPWSEETQRRYHVCQRRQRHIFDEYDPEGGQQVFKHGWDTRGRVIEVIRLVTCENCTTRKLFIYEYKEGKSAHRDWVWVKMPLYDWPLGYLADPEHGRIDRDELLERELNSLPLRESKDA